MKKDLRKITDSERKNIKTFRAQENIHPIPCGICGEQLVKGDRYIGSTGYERHVACTDDA